MAKDSSPNTGGTDNLSGLAIYNARVTSELCYFLKIL